MSIVRIGLAETRNFSNGYDAIFGAKKKAATKRPARKGKTSKKKKTSKRK